MNINKFDFFEQVESKINRLHENKKDSRKLIVSIIKKENNPYNQFYTRILPIKTDEKIDVKELCDGKMKIVNYIFDNKTKSAKEVYNFIKNHDIQ